VALAELERQRERRANARATTLLRRPFLSRGWESQVLFDLPRPVAEPVDAEYPMVHHRPRHFRAMAHNTRTGKSALHEALFIRSSR
jgi:hypothetical protein